MDMRMQRWPAFALVMGVDTTATLSCVMIAPKLRPGPLIGAGHRDPVDTIVQSTTGLFLGLIATATRPGFPEIDMSGTSILILALVLASASPCTHGSQTPRVEAIPGSAGVPYPDMPAVAPIGESIDKYMDVPESARGEAIDPAKGYRLQDLGSGLYMITDNAYQSLFLVYDKGVVVVDAPPSYAARIRQAIDEVSDRPVTHVVYSHSHADHIAGVTAVGGKPAIIAHEETRRLLERAADPARPLPTITFADTYALKVGNQLIELSYHGNAHQPGNIFIHAPRQRVLMVVDVIFPGWMPWRRFAVAQDLPGYFAQVEVIRKMDWDTLVAGHVTRTGTHADVELQARFIADVRQAASAALASTKFGEGLNRLDRANPWAGFDNYIDRVAARCVNTVTPKWFDKLAGFDVYIWDQCLSMEQSLRID
jgi:glyoxylase-like metal-dependent hydrolase (beta-lactamase superfamily II)